MTKVASTVTSAVKVLRALQVLCEAPHPLLLGQLRDALAVSEATAYRAIQTLIATGFVRPANEGGYEPTLEVARLAELVTQRDPLSVAVERAFRDVREQYGEPVTVAVLEVDQARFIKKLTGPRDPSFTCDVGVRLPLYLGAAARCLMSYLSDADFESYLETLPAGQVAPAVAELRKSRARTRRAGYALSEDEVDVGISAIGVPILNRNGEILAAAAIANVTARWSHDDISERAAAMQHCATMVGEVLKDLPAGVS